MSEGIDLTNSITTNYDFMALHNKLISSTSYYLPKLGSFLVSFDKICHKFLVSHIEICLLSISHFVCKYNIVYFIDRQIKTIFASIF